MKIGLEPRRHSGDRERWKAGDLHFWAMPMMNRHELRRQKAARPAIPD
jgi:hypothetical protein